MEEDNAARNEDESRGGGGGGEGDLRTGAWVNRQLRGRLQREQEGPRPLRTTRHKRGTRITALGL
jgi:hypothetical protein